MSLPDTDGLVHYGTPTGTGDPLCGADYRVVTNKTDDIEFVTCTACLKSLVAHSPNMSLSVRARMKLEGIPVGSDNPALIALGAAPLPEPHLAPMLDLVMTRQLAAAVRALHQPRSFDLGQYGIPACSTVCAECRQSWPCATEQAMLNSGSLS